MLSKAAIADLARSGISVATAEACGMFSVDDASTIYPEFRKAAALVLPYFNADKSLMTFTRNGEALPFCRVRYLDANSRATLGGKVKDQRYDQPRGSGQKVYLCPLVDWARVLMDPTEPVIITEGEKKAVVAIAAGFPTIGLGGVFNFMGALDQLIPELQSTDWQRRDTFLGFDSDAVLNPNILTAEARLVDELQRKRGARCYLVRLPSDGEHKVGLDDFLLSHGPQGLTALLQTAPALGALDAKVVALNRSVAWIEKENLIYDLQAREFIPKDSFVTGSKYGTLKHITVGQGQKAQPKEVSVAQKWLTHPHAQRYSQVLFRPGEGEIVTDDNGHRALNMFRPLQGGPGDPTPWLELSQFLFSRMRPEDRDLVVKTLAYKAQHPEVKIPLAPVLIGSQGCGKTLWCEIVAEAFAPYVQDVNPTALSGEFQYWLEQTLIVTVNEAKGGDLELASDRLKTLISDLDQPMNEKYRVQRRVKSYCMYLITSNHHDAGAFSADDRRMIVVDCPDKLADEEFYNRLSRNREWRKNGGPKAVLQWLLDYPLGDWTPPASAPVTAEKLNARRENMTMVQQLAEDMLEADHNTLVRWLEAAEAWATQMLSSSNPALVAQANTVLNNIGQYQIRPWYTALELSRMFPAISSQVHNNRFDRSTPASRISRELREAGIKYLQCSDSEKGFMWKGQYHQFLVIAAFDEWSKPVSQADFERAMANWPTYAALKRRR